jgi:WD40 repeat protein
MFHKIPQLTVIITLLFCTAHAQTQSDCRTSFPFRPDIKPGVGGSFTFTRDGKTLLVPGIDAKIRFFDLASGEIKRTLTSHTNYVYMANFNPDEKLLTSSSRDNTARIWDVASGQILHTFEGFRCAVKVAKFSPDGKLLAASGNDGMLKLYDVKSYKELKSMVHRDSPDIDMATYSFLFSRDGKQIYAGNGDGTISVWDVASGKEIRNWQAHPTIAWKLVISPDYRHLVSLGDPMVKIWDTTTWRELATLSIRRAAENSNFTASALAISHNGKLIAASYVELDSKRTTYLADNTIVWNAKTGEKLFTLSGHKFDINGLIFTPDDRYLLSGGIDATIKFWDMRDGRLTRTITIH